MMMRGDFVSLFEALLLLLLSAAAKERTPLLGEILVFLRSDACLLAQLGHHCATMQRALACAAAAATGDAKRAHAGRVIAHQFKVVAQRLKHFLAKAAWADVRPVRQHITSLLEALQDGSGMLGATDAAAAHTLGTLARKVGSLHLVLADSAAQLV